MRRARWSALLLLGVLAVGGRLLAPPAPAVTGEVAAGGVPVSGARVRFQGCAGAAQTDGVGRFELRRPARAPRRLTAWKPGFAIAAADHDAAPLRLALSPLPKNDNEEYQWVYPAPDSRHANNCANCHAAIYREHAGSAHARSATNRRFLNLFDGTDTRGRPTRGWNLLAQKPDGAGVCAACHAPTFRDPTLEYDFRKVAGVAARGVHCDYCHKVVDAPTDRLGTRFGRDGLTLLRPPDGEQLFFGPLDDAYRAGESFGHLPLYKESRYCASCHEGVVFGVHAYGTYSEWLESPARRRGQQCQSCHMTPTGHLTNIALGRGGIERDPLTLASHGFPGGQADMLRKCLTVTASAGRTAAGVRVVVEVRAENVGHRVPTGFVDRNLVLAVDARGPKGELLRSHNGPTLPPAAGRGFAGLSGKLFAKLLRALDGTAPAPFWDAHGDPEDTRLAPGQPDRSTYTFPADAAAVRVRLLYRRFWPDVADERGWGDNEITVVDHTIPVR